MTWRHLNFFQHQAFLHARVPRVHCTGCGIEALSVPSAPPDSGFTLLFEATRAVKRHWNGILRWFHSRIAKGLIEGLNSLIQAAKAKARGCRSIRNL